MADRRYLIMDCETRIDKELIRQTQYPHMTINDAVATYRQHLSAESQGRSTFIPVTYHIPISIAVGRVNAEYVLTSVETLAYDHAQQVPLELESTLFTPAGETFERAMVEDFWRLVNEGYTLVTFNGRGFDLPVLELAALRDGLGAPRYWNEKYGHRYRFSEDGHYDLQEVLTNGGAAQLRGGLNALLTMLGYVGKDGVDGSMVQDLWEKGEHETIHTYCRRDVICTWALFVRLELIRGRMTPEQYDHVCRQSATFLHQIR